jgi:hypothetical protein
VRGLLQDPLSGEPKRGALKGVRVVKFKVDAQQLLLAYELDEKANVIEVRTWDLTRTLSGPPTVLVGAPGRIRLASRVLTAHIAWQRPLAPGYAYPAWRGAFI